MKNCGQAERNDDSCGCGRAEDEEHHHGLHEHGLHGVDAREGRSPVIAPGKNTKPVALVVSICGDIAVSQRVRT